MSRFRNFAPQVATDLDHAVGWLLDRVAAPGAAERLLTAVLEAGERLATRPQLGRRRPELLPDPFRFWSMPRFGLLLVYDPTTSPAVILRVLNGSVAKLPALRRDGSKAKTGTVPCRISRGGISKARPCCGPFVGIAATA